MTRRRDTSEPLAPLPDTPARAGTLPAFTPVPRLKDRSNGWKPHVQRAFIEALADTGSVTSACRAVNRSTHGAYHLRRQPGAESFRAAWAAALDLGVQRIEDVAMDRALNGVEVPVYSYGKLVGTRLSYNDRLLMFMLRNRAPERFTEGRAKGLGAIGQMELERKKKQWRAEWQKEWEAERAAKAGEREDEVIASIDEKLSAMSERWLTGMSPRTRAAYEEYRRLEREDKEAGYSCYDDPEHESYIARKAPGAGGDAAIPLPPPDWRKREVDEREEENPRWRGLKDEGLD